MGHFDETHFKNQNAMELRKQIGGAIENFMHERRTPERVETILARKIFERSTSEEKMQIVFEFEGEEYSHATQNQSL